MPRIGLILLAAGGSSRMGQPKQLLPWGKGTLLSHACKTALSTSCRPIIVVLGCEAAMCRHAIRNQPVNVIVNEEWKKGLGSSIAAGVRALKAQAPDVSGALFLVADQPTVSPAFLESLVSRWAPPSCPIVATAYAGGGGVPAIFDRTFFPELRALDTDRGARALIIREKARTALVAPRAEPVDLDTLADYHAHLPK